MGKLNFTTTEQNEDQPVWVLRKRSSDKTQSRDIPALAKKYYETIGKRSGEIIPFFVISQGYDKTAGDFMLSIGGLGAHEKLEKLTIPRGLYGKVTIKPKLCFIWGLSIGEAKRAFYTEWLPLSGYESLNMEYEYHTEASSGKSSEIDILFAIQEKRKPYKC